MDGKAPDPSRDIHDGASGEVPSIFQRAGCFTLDEGFEANDVETPPQRARLSTAPVSFTQGVHVVWAIRPNPKDSLVCMSRELDGSGVTEGAVFRGSIGRMVARIKQGTVHKGVIVRLHLRENEVRVALSDALDDVVEQRTLFLKTVRVGEAGIFEEPGERCRRIREYDGCRFAVWH